MRLPAGLRIERVVARLDAVARQDHFLQARGAPVDQAQHVFDSRVVHGPIRQTDAESGHVGGHAVTPSPFWFRSSCRATSRSAGTRWDLRAEPTAQSRSPVLFPVALPA